MGIIRCSGHRFRDMKPTNPFGIVNEFKCIHCGLKVKTKEAALFLEGKPS